LLLYTGVFLDVSGCGDDSGVLGPISDAASDGTRNVEAEAAVDASPHGSDTDVTEEVATDARPETNIDINHAADAAHSDESGSDRAEEPSPDGYGRPDSEGEASGANDEANIQDASESESKEAATDSGLDAQGDQQQGADAADAILGPVGATEQALYDRSPSCLTCARSSGCIDPNLQALSCDGSNPAQTQCINTLTCALTASCGVTRSDPSCLCGVADASTCTVSTTPPNGPCASTYFAGFGTQNAQTILQNFSDSTNPSGDANALVQCLMTQPCPTCLGNVE
jgi:hypothetical protein